MAGQTAKPSWAEHHQVALMRGIVQLVLANRTALYAKPELREVAYNGGDVINRKTKQILTAFAGKDIVADELGAARSTKTGSAPSTPRKTKSKDGSGSVAGSPTKKRKAEVKVEDEDELYSE